MKKFKNHKNQFWDLSLIKMECDIYLNGAFREKKYHSRHEAMVAGVF